MRTRTVAAIHRPGIRRGAVLVMPIVLGILDTPAIKAQALSDWQSAKTLKFEVASIRPCKDSDTTPSRKGGRGGVTVGRFRGSPGSLVGECQTLENLIRWAYLGYRDGKPWPIDKVVGVPMPPLPNR